MANGYAGKIALVDLSTGKTEDLNLDPSMCRSFIGGYGIGAKLLYDLEKPGIDPLGPGRSGAGRPTPRSPTCDD